MSRPARIGILTDHIESTYQVELVEAAVRVAHLRGVKTLIIPGGALTASGTPGRSRGFLYDFLRNASIDAFLVMGGSLSNYCGVNPFDRWLRTLPQLPTVVVGIRTPSAPSVAVNNQKGLDGLVDHLVEKHGRRHIAFVSGPDESFESEARLQAYRAAVDRHGLKLGDEYVIPGGLGREQGIDAVTYLLEDKKLTASTLDAIISYNDDVALGVLEELKRRKIAVPEQVSVVGFDDAPNAHAASPPLTTVSQRVYEQGATAMEHLINAVQSGERLSHQTVRPEIIYRESCGCHMSMQSDTTRIPRRASTVPAEMCLEDERELIADSLYRAAQGRLRARNDWQTHLVSSTIEYLRSRKLRLVHELETIARRSGPTGIEACHDVLTRLRYEVLRATASDTKVRPALEDLFQECRLGLANVTLFAERENQALQSLHLRAVTRVCLERAQSGGLPELAVALEEQLPLLGIRSFCISQGNEDVLDVIARRGRSGPTPRTSTVTTAALGMDERLAEEEAVCILPLSAGGHQVGLASLAWGQADPYLFEKLRDLLGMALSLE